VRCMIQPPVSKSAIYDVERFPFTRRSLTPSRPARALRASNRTQKTMHSHKF
jgi:hypothetical protein